MISNILVLCEGNLCRSPMAAGVLAHALSGVEVHSAGLNAVVGKNADPVAVELMASRGFDIGAHVARQVVWEEVQRADLLFVMTSAQKKAVEMLYAFSKGKVFRIGEHGRFDIADPYRQGRLAFAQAFDQITQGLESWLPPLHKLSA